VYTVNSDTFLCGPDVMITTSNYKFNDGAPALIREAEAPATSASARHIRISVYELTHLLYYDKAENEHL